MVSKTDKSDKPEEKVTLEDLMKEVRAIAAMLEAMDRRLPSLKHKAPE